MDEIEFDNVRTYELTLFFIKRKVQNKKIILNLPVNRVHYKPVP